MFVSGRFGLKAYDITVPTVPKLLDWLGDGVNDPFLEDGNPGDGSQAPRRGTLDDMWENEDMDVDENRKLVFLSRDPRAYGGSTGNPASRSGIYVIDVRDPEQMRVITFVETPTGHTTTCINDCRWLWTGGPAPNTTQQAMGWAGRPIFATDMRDPHHPKVYTDPIDLNRNDGRTDYSHDVQVDEAGVAWVSGRGGVRGYWTNGHRYDPTLGVSRVATAFSPVPFAGGGLEETVFPTRTSSRFMHNAWRPLGDDAPDASYGDLIYGTEEEFAGGAFPNGCRNDGPLFIASLEGSYDGEAWRSTPDNKFRLKTVATWHPFGKEGSSTSTDCSAHYFQIQDRILSMSFYSQGSRFLDITDPTSPTEIAYFRPRHRDVGDLPAQGPLLLGRPERRLRPAPDRPDGSRRASRGGRPASGVERAGARRRGSGRGGDRGACTAARLPLQQAAAGHVDEPLLRPAATSRRAHSPTAGSRRGRRGREGQPARAAPHGECLQSQATDGCVGGYGSTPSSAHANTIAMPAEVAL